MLVICLTACTKKGGSVHTSGDLPDFDALWDYSDPGGTERAFKELLPAARVSNDVSYYIQLMTQIARTQGLQRKFKEAHATLDSIKDLISEELVVASVRYLLERGRVINSSGDPKKAKPYFLDAYEIARVHNEDFYTIDAIHMLQIVDLPEEQLQWADAAIKIAEKTTDERAKKWLGPLYNNTGWTYFDLQQYDNALEFFEKSLAYQQSLKDEQETIIAKWTIARTYREIGRVGEALELQQALEKEIEEKGLDADGYVYEEIAECLLILMRKDESRPYFAKAYEILSQDPWLEANEPERLERLKNIGDVQ
jgi:tetratricopeptide (TPR) repeat protein